MSSKEILSAVFKNKAYLRNLPAIDLIETLFDKSAQHFIGSYENKLLISTEARGDDLVVSYVFFQ